MPSDSSVPCLDGADRVFHDAYSKARDDSEGEAPLLVVLASELALHVRGERRAFAYSHPPFHSAKVAAHVAVALYTLTTDSRPEQKAANPSQQVEAIRVHVRRTLESLGDETGELGELERELVPLLKCSLEYADHVVTEHQVRGQLREDFARACGPLVLRVTELATCGQIGALHEAFERVLGELSPAERTALQVVVVGDHQARSRSLGMQYFQRRFGEHEGADDRVTYGENVADEAEAIALVGTRRLDCAIARAFFADEKRLQRDVLGDAAKRCLDRMKLEPVDAPRASEPTANR